MASWRCCWVGVLSPALTLCPQDLSTACLSGQVCHDQQRQGIFADLAPRKDDAQQPQLGPV